MISSGRHPKKELTDALRRAEQADLDVEEIHRGHRWGEVTCVPCSARFAVCQHLGMLARTRNKSTGSPHVTRIHGWPGGLREVREGGRG